MHPAPSIIIFTTLSGAGFGLLGLLFLGIGPFACPAFLWVSAILGFGMAIGGLLASTFHLGHPERAWRALTQWRSSWLSREGVLAVLTLAAGGIYAIFLLFGGVAVSQLGTIAALLSIATVYSTAMIYAQMKTVPHWNSALTPAMFLASALSTGLLALTFVASFAGPVPAAMVVISIVLVILAWGLNLAMWRRNAETGLSGVGSSPETATGLGALGRVRLLEAPHSSPNYLMREMVYKVGRKHAQKLRRLALLVGGALPLVLLLLAGTGFAEPFWLLLAFATHLAGILIGRWLFFAEAEHAVSLYYGHR
ncbi:MAG: DmsC/YnfH family molybdoenzyme membrane anchor subunit [Stappiaceae bacterium]